MRYPEPRERSAELLRLALARMGQHDAAFNPLTFAVWYEYVAGTNAALSKAVDGRLQNGLGLDSAAMAQLYDDHVREPGQAELQRANGELQRVMTGMAESAALTGNRAGAFGAELSDLSRVLAEKGTGALEPAVNRALAETQSMRAAAQSLQERVTASQVEIERLRDALSRARDAALTDPLTRVLNREGFDRKLQAMLDTAPAADHQHCLLILDLDHFKSINDNYGHVMGDRVLQAVAEAMGRRITDPAHSIARYGGEEFAVLLPDCSADQAMRLADALRLAIRDMKVRDRRSNSIVLTVTASVGVACMAAGDDAASLIARADAAMYAAKQAGRNCVRSG